MTSLRIDVKETESSNTAGGTVKCYNNFGKYLGKFLRS